MFFKQFKKAIKNFFDPNQMVIAQKPEISSSTELSTDKHEGSIFVSYSHKNSSLVNQLANYLAQEEIPPWIDNQLKFGDSWNDLIVGRIRQCKVFLLMMSKDSIESKYVHQEIDLALSEKKVIIPILLSGEPFEKVKDLQYIKNILDTIHPKSDFVEQLRELVAPSMIPSAELQRRRINDFALRLFRNWKEGIGDHNLFAGFGFDVEYGIKLDFSLQGADELDWTEIFINIREKLPLIDFGHQLGKDYAAIYPTVAHFADFLFENLEWQDIQKL